MQMPAAPRQPAADWAKQSEKLLQALTFMQEVGMGAEMHAREREKE